MRERDYAGNLKKYMDGLDQVQRESFAPLDLLLKNSMSGLDLHVLAVKATKA